MLRKHSQLPDWQKDNPSIHTGYRSNYSSIQSVVSIFQWHNECGNIWTHLAGVILFAMIIYGPNSYLYELRHLEAQQVPQVPMPEACRTPNPNGFNPLITTWCLLGSLSEEASHLIFLVSAKLCLLGSTVYHTFSAHQSSDVVRFFNRLDYLGISFLITGSTFPFVFYVFHCDFTFRASYLLLMSMIGCSITVASFFRFWATASFRKYRALTYVIFGLLGAVPFLQLKLVNVWTTGSFADTPAERRFPIHYPLLMGLFYVVGAGLYAARCPEKYLPGKVDFVFQSHQLFHVFVVLGAYTHYAGCHYAFSNHRRFGVC